MMAQAGEIVFRKREAFIEEFIPIFQSFYSFISQDKEQVDYLMSLMHGMLLCWKC